MPTPTEIHQYKKEFFKEPYLHLRFELGDELENGTEARVEQATNRANILFADTFQMTKKLSLYVEDYGGKDIMFGNTTPGYLYEVLQQALPSQQFKAFRDSVELIEETRYDSVIKKTDEVEFSGYFGEISLDSLPYQKIFCAIANYEQGFEPGIGQRVEFFDLDNRIYFNMYDDRGCLIAAKTRKSLQHIYDKYSAWLVDYQPLV